MDIRQLAWTQPQNREASVLYFGIKRAKEEIWRLNVEILHLISFMVDDHTDYVLAIRNHVMTNPDLAHELSEQWVQRTRINESIALRLIQTWRLPGFSGSLFPGNRVGRDPSLNERVPLPGWATKYIGLVRQVVEYDEVESDDDGPRELQGGADLVMDLMERLSVIDMDDTTV
ncbi:hypothetical protein C8J57DRAFT_1529798 [Mycena rebaudengoi]|nr:hypothetical protein C8J57DRAFT_1529798 [Mycena rebaudengoi]